MEGLFMRYESPDPRSKWDSPLFVLHPDEMPPYDEIIDALLKRKSARAHQATRPHVLADTNFLYELDQTTQEIVAALSEAQQQPTFMPGDHLAVPRSSRKVLLDRKVSIMQLRKLRAQFLKIAQ
mmetsp:Transcript_16154/g.26633  ORF Transcript_16154/g.26633 Transcript_16154/m.26633 type:complete len:124 (+) Transcript_16154:391-762(+)